MGWRILPLRRILLGWVFLGWVLLLRRVLFLGRVGTILFTIWRGSVTHFARDSDC